MLEFTDFRRCAIALIPKGHGPAWSKCLNIEYREEWGGFPDEDERAALAEALGFLFGRQLLDVGITAFDDAGLVVESVAQKPWGSHVLQTCADYDYPPIRVERYSAEVIFQPLVRAYLEKRRALDLSMVLWTYWISRRTTIGFDLTLLSSALERLSIAWFKSSRTKTAGTYMPKQDYEKLLHAELTSAAEKLSSLDYGKRMVNRLNNAFQMGSNERVEIFFEEIGLPIGEGERLALKARNSPSHGGNSQDNVAYQIWTSAVYRVLLQRVLLHLLDYSGSYVDYSTSGHPLRPMSEPVGTVPFVSKS